jgi:L-seryl-tRNA(Ser) seleniumtransferase
MEYIRQNHDAVPFLRMLRLSAEEVRARAAAIQENLKTSAILKTEIIAGESLIGGGSAPTSTLKTYLLAITVGSLSASDLAARLRHHDPPIIARVEEGRVLLDLRTVLALAEDEQIARALLSLAIS